MLNNFVIKSFVVWRIAVFVFIAISITFVPLQQHHLGGGMGTYLDKPIFWSMANFDGEHYLSIAQYGYKALQYFFFPLYPVLVGIFSISDTPFGLALTAQILSNVLILIALFGLWRLVRLDYSPKKSRYTLLLLLVFPTSFYFVAVYTESLFLALTVWAFYFARTKQWFLAVGCAALATSTRIIGLAIIPALLLEAWSQYKQTGKVRPLLLLPLSLLGISAYVYFLYRNTGDALAFKTSLEMVYGEQRSDSIILLPQVIYRYLFKVLPNLNWAYFQGTFGTLLEFGSAILFFMVSLWALFKMRISYAVYLALGFIIPTFSGSFSSMGRYMVVLFPAFIAFADFFDKLSSVWKIVTIMFCVVSLGLATAFFSRGYWIA